MELNRLILIAALFTIVSMPMLSFSPLKCRKNAVEGYVNIAKNLVKKMELCAVPPLNDTVVIPLVGVVLCKWKKMNETVRKTEILSNLGLLLDALAQVNVQAVPDCANELLKKLTKNIEDREQSINASITMETVRKTEMLSNLRLRSGALAQVNVQAVPHCANETLKKPTKNIEDREQSIKANITMSRDTSAPPILEDLERRNTSNILEIFECYQNLMAGKIKMYLLNNCPTKSR